MTEYTQADLDQNKAVNRVVDQLVVALAMLDKLQHAVDALAPVIKVVESAERLIERVEQAVHRLEHL